MTDLQTSTGATPAPEPDPDGTPVRSRRALLAGAGALGAGCLLAACGTSQGGSTQGTNPNGSDFNADPAPAGSRGAQASGASGAGSGTVLAAAADVPVGGGLIKGDYVITQPTKNSFRAFSKVCTHQGCDVNKVEGGLISCPCHGSQFSIADGAPQNGPAPKPLPQTQVKLSGGNVVTA